MKKVFLFVFLLLLAGCGQTIPPAIPTPTTTVPATDQLTITPTQPENNQPEKVLDLNIYKKWKLPQRVVSANQSYFKDSGVSDCIGLENGFVDGGDLLSTLIIDSDARKLMNLKAYSSEYVLKLENAVVKASHEKYSSDLYAFSVCHLSDNVDIVAGILWPTGKSSTDSSFGERKILVLVNNFSPVFFENVSTLNKTATGAGVMPCSATLSANQNVLWSCFTGLHFNGSQVDGSKMTEWTLSLIGGIPLKRDYVDWN